MNRFSARTKAGQYTWLQLLGLGLSLVAYMLGMLPAAIVCLLFGTVFGVLATLARIKEAQRIRGQLPRTRRR